MRRTRLAAFAALLLLDMGCSGDDGSGTAGTDGTDSGTSGATDSTGSTDSTTGVPTTGDSTTSPTGATDSGPTGSGSATSTDGTSSTGTGGSATSGGSTGGGSTGGGAACYPDNTADPTPADFSDVRLPFFRGEICTVENVPPGVDIPMSFKACVHPCMTPGAFHRLRYDDCTNGECTGWFILWYDTTSGTSCPADGFGRFDKADCVEAAVVNSGFLAQTEGGNDVTSGTLTAVVPFMTNDDIIEVDDHMGSVGELLAIVDGKMTACPPTDDRIFTFDIDPGHPAPPADCDDNPACTCREVGYLP